MHLAAQQTVGDSCAASCTHRQLSSPLSWPLAAELCAWSESDALSRFAASDRETALAGKFVGSQPAAELAAPPSFAFLLAQRAFSLFSFEFEVHHTAGMASQGLRACAARCAASVQLAVQAAV